MSFKTQLALKKQAEAKARQSAPRGRKGRTVPKDYIPPPLIDEFDLPLKAVRELNTLMHQHHEITKQQSELKADKEALTEDIKKLCILYKIDFFQLEGLQAKIFKTRRTTIDKGLLLALGISHIQIIKATKVSNSESLKITEVGKTEEEDYEP